MLGGKVLLLGVGLAVLALASTAGASPNPNPPPKPQPPKPQPGTPAATDWAGAARDMVNAVKRYGYKDASAFTTYFQTLYNRNAAIFQGPPAPGQTMLTPIAVDGIYGPETRQAAINAGVSNPPAPYFMPGGAS